MNKSPLAPATLFVILVVAPAAWLAAGILNPPVGPVAPTMRTNQEIYDAVTGLAGSGGDCTECAAGFSGAVRGVGTITMSSLPGAGGTLVSDVYTFEYTIANTGGGAPQGSNFVITRAIDSASHRFFRACTSLTPIMTATIRLTQDGTNVYYLYTLGDVRVRSVHPTMIRRCDGMYVHGEEIELSAIAVRFTEEATDHFWEWSFATGIGTGG